MDYCDRSLAGCPGGRRSDNAPATNGVSAVATSATPVPPNNRPETDMHITPIALIASSVGTGRRILDRSFAGRRGGERS